VTKRTLDLGERLMELLKQNQYEPLRVERQVAVIWAATFPAKPKNKKFKDNPDYPEGMFILDIPAGDMRLFESELLKYLDANASELLDKIRSAGKIDEQVEMELFDAVTKFRKSFLTRYAKKD
jgi:F-type H+-transporting ATPase subunit alpha